MFRGFSNYRVVYRHLGLSYGSSWYVRASFLLRLVSQIAKLIALPVALSRIITELSAANYAGAQRAVLVFVGISLIIGIVTPLIRYIGMLGENTIYRQSTVDYFGRLVDADIDYFNSNLSGYLTSATRQYVDSCINLVRNVRDRYLATILAIVFPLAVIAWLDIWLGLIAFTLSLLQAGYLIWASHTISPYRTATREVYKRNSGKMADAISNILVIKSSAQEKRYIGQIGTVAAEEAAIFMRRYTRQAKLIAVREVITVMFFLALLWLTVQKMSLGSLDITAAVLVATYTTTILTGIYNLSDNLDEHDDFIDKIIPGLEILNRRHLVNDPAKPRRFRRIQGSIQLDKVSFSYSRQPGQQVLRGLSLDIPAGQKVGIVGLSGAGKSTLTKLLLRFNDVDSGTISIDGIDIRSIRQHDLRACIAYVPQEPLLFHTSIRDNVTIARPGASDAVVIRALKAAHAYDFVRDLPEGLDSIVGERGVKLSGGQKQRIAIARAVLRQTPIMVLDEATSALDSESEQIIKDSFGQILANKTALVVAHRLSTLSDMDRIVVIEDGVVTEDGSHAELLAIKGSYARLWRHQQRATSP